MGKKKESLGDRMKSYESISKHFLTRRVPVIIRLDGKAFHTFTKGFEKPFDAVLMRAMQNTMKYLCENIQGCIFGYTQSDEITLVLTDYATITTDAWFGYNVQKMASVAASMATLAFNLEFQQAVIDWNKEHGTDMRGYIARAEDPDLPEPAPELIERAAVYHSRYSTALFDARAFSIPKEEVCNCLIWRQQDATRNSIMAVGQAHFSHKELQGKSCDMVQDMLWTLCGINWNDLPVDQKRGACCYRKSEPITKEDPLNPGETIEVERRAWVIDREPPIFTKDRNYVEGWLYA